MIPCCFKRSGSEDRWTLHITFRCVSGVLVSVVLLRLMTHRFRVTLSNRRCSFNWLGIVCHAPVTPCAHLNNCWSCFFTLPLSHVVTVCLVLSCLCFCCLPDWSVWMRVWPSLTRITFSSVCRIGLTSVCRSVWTAVDSYEDGFFMCQYLLPPYKIKFLVKRALFDEHEGRVVVYRVRTRICSCVICSAWEKERLASDTHFWVRFGSVLTTDLKG